MTDTLSWQIAALDNLLTQCEIQTDRNVTNWILNTTSGFSEPDPTIIDNICIANCGGTYGKCVKGTLSVTIYIEIYF